MERGTVNAVAGLLIVTGLVVMAGWAFRIPALLIWHPDWVVMVFNTALGFVLLGVGLFAASSGRTRLQWVTSVLLGLLAATVLAQFILDRDFGIDQLLVEAWTADHNLHPGRMAIATTLLFLVCAAILLCGALRGLRPLRALFAWVGGVLVSAAGLASLVAYLIGFSAVSGLAGLTLMAAHTSLAFALAGVGLAVIGAGWSPEIVADRQRWGGAVAAALIFVAGFNLWQGMAGYQMNQLHAATERAAAGVARNLVRGQAEHRSALERMAARMEVAGMRMSVAEWQEDADGYLAAFPGFRTLSWLDGDGRYVDVRTQADVTADNLGQFVTDEHRERLLAQARERMAFTAAPPLDLRLGGRGTLLLVPFSRGGEVHMILASVEYARLFGYLLEGVAPGYVVSLDIAGETVYRSHPGVVPKFANLVSQTTVPAVVPWETTVWPEAESVAATAGGPLPAAALILSLVAAILVAVSMHYAALARVRLRDAEHAGKALREQVEVNEVIWSDAQDLFLILDFAGTLQRVSVASQKILGYTPEEMVGRSFTDFLEPADVVRARLAFEALVRDGVMPSVDVRWRNRDGVLVYLDWSAIRSQRLGVCIGVARDLTERMQREIRLARSEERLRLALDRAKRVVYERDLVTGESEWVGPTSLLLGYSPQEMAHMPRVERHRHVHPEDVVQARLVDEAVSRGGGAFTMEYRWQRPDGTWVWIEDVGAVEKDRMRAVITDVTARHETEALLERRVVERTEELRRANAELESFSYSVSHDLRTPLRAISSFAELLVAHESARLDREGRHYLQRVIDGAGRMNQLIDDLLQLSRVTRQEVKRGHVDVTAVAEHVVQQLRDTEPERQVEVVIQPGLVASADPRQVEIVLANLLGNAWKFTGGTVAPKIGLEADGPGFRVFDNGAGFDMQYSSNLFGVFQRLHAGDRFPGTGVGLAIVKRIVERHGGHIRAEAEVGKGARFYFDFGG